RLAGVRRRRIHPPVGLTTPDRRARLAPICPIRQEGPGSGGCCRAVTIPAKDTEMKRSYAVATVAVAALLGSAGAASADELYPPPPEPTLEVSAGSLCIGDVPYLEWEAKHGTEDADDDDATLTLTFLNPSGPDHVVSGQPLSGTMLWPGAAADSEGNGTDWPGWKLVDGTWVEGDEWDW